MKVTIENRVLRIETSTDELADVLDGWNEGREVEFEEYSGTMSIVFIDGSADD